MNVALPRWATVLLLLTVPAIVPATTVAEQERPFVIAINDSELKLHPHRSFTVTEAQIFTAMYEGLVSYNPLTLAPEAAVAERWEVSEDGTVYTFHLRPDAAYWNGDAVTADHFRDAWLMLLQPDANAYFSVLFDVIAGATAYRTGEISDPQQVGIVALDRQTLQVTLSEPAPFFLSTLCHYSFSPIHPRMQRIADWNSAQVLLTNGPYVLLQNNTEMIRFVQNKRYWDRNANNFHEIIYLHTDDTDDVFTQFVERKIDWIMSGFGEDITRYHSSLRINPILGTGFYFFVANTNPWDNPDVRRALALSVPWAEIRNRSAYSFPTAALVPPLPGYETLSGIAEQNTTEAARLLAASGYEQGAGLPALTIAIPDTEEEGRIANLMAAHWRSALGLTVDIRRVPIAEYFAYIETADDYTIGRMSWIGDYLDPLAFLQLWSSDSNLNHAHYRDTEYDRLLRQAATQNDNERFESLRAAEQLILDGALILPIHHSVAVNAIDSEQIQGWYVNILDIHPAKHIGRRRNFLLPGIARVHPPQ